MVFLVVWAQLLHSTYENYISPTNALAGCCSESLDIGVKNVALSLTFVYYAAVSSLISIGLAVLATNLEGTRLGTLKRVVLAQAPIGFALFGMSVVLLETAVSMLSLVLKSFSNVPDPLGSPMASDVVRGLHEYATSQPLIVFGLIPFAVLVVFQFMVIYLGIRLTPESGSERGELEKLGIGPIFYERWRYRRRS